MLNAVHPVIPSRYKCSNKRKQSQQIDRYRNTKYKIWKGKCKHKEAIGSGFSWPLVSGSREVQIGAKLQAGNTAVQKGNTGKQAGNTEVHWPATRPDKISLVNISGCRTADVWKIKVVWNM